MPTVEYWKKYFRKMKKWQIENSEKSEISEISEILFRVLLFPSFWFCLPAKNENLDLKILKKNFRDFRDFQGFQVFDLASFYFIFFRFLFSSVYYLFFLRNIIDLKKVNQDMMALQWWLSAAIQLFPSHSNYSSFFAI